MQSADKRDPKSYAVIGAAMEVHKELGPGFLEAVYQEAMEIELKARDIPFQAQPPLTLHYKGQQLNKHYIPDFICCESLVIEIKAVKELNKEHQAQILNALKAAKCKVGLLINFGEPSLVFKRYVN